MLRITGGELKGRSIQAPPNERTRPTQARLRQALFNSLQAVITDAQVLDLFAGSGALAFEALSWGAAHAVLVESARPVTRYIQKNAASLGVGKRITLVAEPVERSFARLKALGPFDLILADPPYEAGWEAKLLREAPWGDLLREGGHLCFEWSPQKSGLEELPGDVPFLVKVREKNYGDSVLTTFVHRREVADT